MYNNVMNGPGLQNFLSDVLQIFRKGLINYVFQVVLMGMYNDMLVN